MRESARFSKATEEPISTKGDACVSVAAMGLSMLGESRAATRDSPPSLTARGTALVSDLSPLALWFLVKVETEEGELLLYFTAIHSASLSLSRTHSHHCFSIVVVVAASIEHRVVLCLSLLHCARPLFGSACVCISLSLCVCACFQIAGGNATSGPCRLLLWCALFHFVVGPF